MNLNCFFILCALTVFTIPGLLYSQDEKEERNERDSMEIEIEEVVVTGTRTSEKILNIPFSVFKVDNKEMRYARNVSVKDILNDVPGLFLQSRYGSHDVRISIRGYGTRSNSGVRGIKILQDGIPESEPDGETNIDAIDYTSLETVEVAKGNLSSLYTNAPGGVINFITDMKFSSNYLKQTNEFGDYGLRQNGLKTGLLTKNYKFFASYSYRNFVGFREHSNEYIHLVNSFMQIFPDDNTSISIMGNFARGLVKLPGALTKAEYDNDPFKAYSVAVSSDFKRDLQKGRVAIQYNTTFGKRNENQIEITGFGQIKDLEYTTNQLYNISPRYVLGSMLKYVNRSNIFSRKNDFSIGTDYNYVNGTISSYANLGGVKGDELQSQNVEIINNFGLYVQNQFYIYKEKSSIFLSGRYDDIKFTNNNQQFGLRNSDKKYGKFTYKAAFNYKIFPTVAVYTSYGHAFDTPAAAELENYPYSSNPLPTLNPDLKPQKSKNFELGIKGNILSRESEIFEKAFFEFTFFNTKINDEIVPFIINDQTFFRNAASTNRTGLECGIKLEMFEGMEIATNYTYSNFAYDSYDAISYTSGGEVIREDYSGKIVPAVPKHLINFILNYDFKLSENITVFPLIDMDYVSSMYVDDANTEKAAGYYYANALLGFNIILNRLNFLTTAGVNNIFDRKYVGFININANPELPLNERRYYEPGEPRSFYGGINIGYRF